MKRPMILWLTLNTGRNVSEAFFSCHRRDGFSASLSMSTSSSIGFQDPEYFLAQVETTVQKVLAQQADTDILKLENQEREAVGVARHLNARLQGLRKNNDCPRCWMQRAHCICQQCPPLPKGGVSLNRLFLLMHHKEIAMKVDTAKLLLAAFPEQCRLVVGGIGPQYQDSMKELVQAMTEGNNNCLLLFPGDDAKTISDIRAEDRVSSDEDKLDSSSIQYDLVVLDGTWAQARKLCSRYIPSHQDGGPRQVELSQRAVATLEAANDMSGHQLRRHAVAWKQVGTFAATCLLLRDLEVDQSKFDDMDREVNDWHQIERYQEFANDAARRELGPPRASSQE